MFPDDLMVQRGKYAVKASELASEALNINVE